MVSSRIALHVKLSSLNLISIAVPHLVQLHDKQCERRKPWSITRVSQASNLDLFACAAEDVTTVGALICIGALVFGPALTARLSHAKSVRKLHEIPDVCVLTHEPGVWASTGMLHAAPPPRPCPFLRMLLDAVLRSDSLVVGVMVDRASLVVITVCTCTGGRLEE